MRTHGEEKVIYQVLFSHYISDHKLRLYYFALSCFLLICTAKYYFLASMFFSFTHKIIEIAVCVSVGVGVGVGVCVCVSVCVEADKALCSEAEWQYCFMSSQGPRKGKVPVLESDASS